MVSCLDIVILLVVLLSLKLATRWHGPNRGYYIGDLSSARAVVAQLPKWFEDYNETAPHKGLKMLSPRQFRRERELKNLTG